MTQKVTGARHPWHPSLRGPCLFKKHGASSYPRLKKDKVASMLACEHNLQITYRAALMRITRTLSIKQSRVTLRFKQCLKSCHILDNHLPNSGWTGLSKKILYFFPAQGATNIWAIKFKKKSSCSKKVREAKANIWNFSTFMAPRLAAHANARVSLLKDLSCELLVKIVAAPLGCFVKSQGTTIFKPTKWSF